MSPDLRRQTLLMPTGRVAETYAQIRDKRDACTAEAKRYQRQMNELAGVLFEMMDREEQELFRTADTGRTVYRYELTTASVKDRQLFLDYVKENNLFELMEVRADKTMCQQYEDIAGKPPVGVELNVIVKLGVRGRTTEPKGK